VTESARQEAPEPLPEMVRERPARTVVGRSFSFRLGSQILSALINVAGMVVLGNYLAAAGYGEYAFYYALIPLLASLTDLGVGVMVTRGIARHPEDGPRYLGDALLIKGGVALLVLPLAALCAMKLDGPHAVLILLVTASAVIDLSQDVGIWVFRGHDRQDLEGALLMVSQVVWLAGILLCVQFHGALRFALGSATLAFLLRSAVGLWIVIRLYGRPVFAPEWRRLRGLIAEGLPFGLAMFAVAMYGRAGVIFLKGMASDSDVAYFNVGYMLSQPLGFISSAFSVSVFPSLARRALQGREAIRPVLRKAVKFQFLAALPISVGLFLLSGRVVPMLLHHGDFRKAGVALMIISLGLGLIFLNLMSRYVLTALDQQGAYLKAILVGLVVNAALCVLLIRKTGFIGACVGLLGGELAVLIMCQMALARYTSPGDLGREAARPLAAALGMGVVVFLLRNGNLLAVPLLGATVYVVLLLALKTFSTDELHAIRGVLMSFRLRGSS
jgi:O-antigen/teichoic acid export membrane protein